MMTSTYMQSHNTSYLQTIADNTIAKAKTPQNGAGRRLRGQRGSTGLQATQKSQQSQQYAQRSPRRSPKKQQLTPGYNWISQSQQTYTVPTRSPVRGQEYENDVDLSRLSPDVSRAIAREMYVDSTVNVVNPTGQRKNSPSGRVKPGQMNLFHPVSPTRRL